MAVTNLLLTYFAAQGGVSSLGSFALVSALYFAVLVLARALVAEPYMATASSQFQHLYGSLSVISAFVASVISGIVAIFFFPGSVPWYLMPLLVCGLILYEFARIRAYVSGRSGIALLASLVVAAIVTIFALFDTDRSEARWLHMSSYWALAGLVGFVLIVLITGGFPLIRAGTWAWFKAHLLPQGRSLVLDSAGVVLVAHVGLFLIGQFGSLAQVASVRATASLLSPVSLVFTGLTVSLTPTLRGADGKTRAKTLKVFWGLVLTASALATAVVAVFGTSIISVVFGASTVPPYATLIVAVLSVVFFSLGSPLLAQVRVFSSYFGIAAIRVVTGILTIVLLIFCVGGDLGLVFFCCQLGQAALILVGAWFIVRKGRNGRLGREELRGEVARAGSRGDNGRQA